MPSSRDLGACFRERALLELPSAQLAQLPATRPQARQRNAFADGFLFAGSWNIASHLLFGRDAVLKPRRNSMENHMIGKIVAAAALALCFGTAALAQNSGASGSASGSGSSGSGGGSMGTTSSGGGSMGGPRPWSGNIGKTFYSDEAGTQLRSRDQIKQGWSSLNSNEQAQVRSDCQEIAKQAASNNGRTPGTEDTSGRQVSGAQATDLPQNSGSGSASGGTDTGTTASVNGGASMRGACDIVKGM
jgi:hypothetical protein